MRERISQDDPFDAVLRPPPDESDEQRSCRLAQEAEASRISHAIDEAIRAEKQRLKKKRIVRVLLLGQSESGKSTTLRQFQRLYTPTAFREERILWRAVIQLNLVRSVRTILDAVSDVVRRRVARLASGSDEPDSEDDRLGPLDDLQTLLARLDPVRHLEGVLIERLVPAHADEPTDYAGYPTLHPAWASQEIFVRPGTMWKGKMAQGQRMSWARPRSEDIASMAAPDEVTTGLNACRRDMAMLWENATARRVLRRKRLRLEESPGFFLNNLDHITTLDYLPNDDDVLRARLKTVGVSEYIFEMETEAGREVSTEWRIIDVGGSRSQRASWVPYFDNVDAIIFLAPISGFDQVLVEDRTVNRLEDSVLLWKDLCANKLLANVELILFLNKCDILGKKLESGVRLVKYVRSYGDRPNDLETASKYFRSKFSAIQREHSPQPRKFYGFCTSVTDTTTTSGILASVRDIVVRQNLARSRMI